MENLGKSSSVKHGFAFAEIDRNLDQTLRTLLALAAYYDLEVEQFDVVTAFLNADLTDSEVYMAQPDGYVKYDDNGVPYVCKLNKAIYGLKQTPREWNQLLTAWLVSYGWTQNLADPGCFTITADGHLHILAVYVDDCIHGATTYHPVRTF